MILVRLGEAEKATYHFKQAGPEADPDVMGQAKIVLGHLKKCDEAKRLKDWHTVLRESGNAVTAGADSAPMVSIFCIALYLMVVYLTYKHIGSIQFSSFLLNRNM